MAAQLERSGRERYLIFALRSFPKGRVPAGSKRVSFSTYRSFLRFLDENDIGEAFFAANLAATPLFWLEALLDGRILLPILRRERAPTANLLLEEIVDKDLEARSIKIRHPHSLGTVFKLMEDDQIRCGDEDLANRLRLFDLKPLSRSAVIIPESRIIGLTYAGGFEVVATEVRRTDDLLQSLAARQLQRYRRLILHKVVNDPTQISYPVIGVRTVELCRSVGITDIFLDSDGVVQGKEEVLRAARAAGISVRSMQEV